MLTCVVHNYNRAHYIEKCLESILFQKTKYKFVIIVVDDCSTDNSKQIVEKIKNKYSASNLYFFSTKKNTGLGRNAIIDLYPQIKKFFNSKYLYRIDSDDYLIDFKKFEKQITFLESRPDCIGICHPCKVFNEKDNSFEQGYHSHVGVFTAEELIKHLVNGGSLYNHTSTYLYRNHFQAALPPLFYLPWNWGDVLYNFCMIKFGNICITDDVMSVYRLHPSGAWSSKSKRKQKFLNNLMTYRIFLVLSPKHKIYFLFLSFKKLYVRIRKIILALIPKKIKVYLKKKIYD